MDVGGFTKSCLTFDIADIVDFRFCGAKVLFWKDSLF